MNKIRLKPEEVRHCIQLIPQPADYAEWIRVVGALRDCVEDIPTLESIIREWCPDYKIKGLATRLRGIKYRDSVGGLIGTLKRNGINWRRAFRDAKVQIPKGPYQLHKINVKPSARVWGRPDESKSGKFKPASMGVVMQIMSNRFGFNITSEEAEAMCKRMAGIINSTDHGTYALSDSERRIFMMRRIDGGLFTAKDGTTAKSLFMAGSDAQWLVGAPVIQKLDKGTPVWLCEGLPDTLALSWILSKSNRSGIVATAPSTSWRPYDELKGIWGGKKVFICLQNDLASYNAGKVWRNHLMPCGASVSLVTPRGLLADQDIADLLKLNGKDFQPTFEKLS